MAKIAHVQHISRPAISQTTFYDSKDLYGQGDGKNGVDDRGLPRKKRRVRLQPSRAHSQLKNLHMMT
eukprot:2363696-Pleurochrysis_carterae.AAC.1